MLKLSVEGKEKLTQLYSKGFPNLSLEEMSLWDVLSDLTRGKSPVSLLELLTPGADTIIGRHTAKHPRLTNRYLETVKTAVTLSFITNIPKPELVGNLEGKE